MKYLLMSLAGLSLAGCAHTAAVETPQQVVWSFKAVDQARWVNAETQKPEKSPSTKSEAKTAKNKKPSKKFIAVAPVAPTPEAKVEEQPKILPVEKLGANIREKIKRSGDLVDKQEHLLAQDLEMLKNEKSRMENEKAYFDYQAQTYRYASLKPVIDGFKRASAGLSKDIKIFEYKINKFEQDLNHLRNPGIVPVTGDVPTDKILSLVQAGHWDIGSELAPEKRLLWNFLQSVGAEIAANN